MGMAKYYEDNTEIIEERRDIYGEYSCESNYNYNNMIARTRKAEPVNKTIKPSYYIVFNGKRIAV